MISKDLLRASPQWLVGWIEEVFAFESALESLPAGEMRGKRIWFRSSLDCQIKDKRRHKDISWEEYFLENNVKILRSQAYFLQ